MIKLFYTGSAQALTSQSVPSASLGGFISNTAVSNGLTNSLFDNLSTTSIYSGKKEFNIIGLGLQIYYFDGEEQPEKTDIECLFRYTEDAFDEEGITPELKEEIKKCFWIEVGTGPVSKNANGDYYVEKIQSIKSLPYYLNNDFKKLKEEESIVLKDINTELGCCLWIKRIFDSRKLDEIFNCQSDFWLIEDHLRIPSLKFDFEINLNLVQG